MNEIVSTATPEPAGAGRRLGIAASRYIVGFALTVGILGITSGLWLLDPDVERLEDVLSRTIEDRGIDAAVADYLDLRERGFAGLRESESDTNGLGYALLRQGENESAIRIFELNVETHPEAANVYDSLAEAHLAAGNRALAIEYYEKALEIDPKKKSAVSALAKLTGTKRRPYRPIVLVHICAGLVGLLSGAAAMSLRKGSPRHGVAGNVFFVSMLSMSSSGAYVAFADPHGEVVNVLMGTLTFYLVATAWLTARRRSEGTSFVDGVALLVVLATGASLVRYGFEAAASPARTKDGIAAGMYLVFGAVALLAAAGDLGMIARGGVPGAQRIARHLWRMCTALFIAVTSLFLGQPQVFPDALRNSGLLVVPGILVVISLIFWLIRVLSRVRGVAAPPTPASPASPAGSTA